VRLKKETFITAGKASAIALSAKRQLIYSARILVIDVITAVSIKNAEMIIARVLIYATV
jgi:hypothetical protein